jgi:hypothetical protein
MLNLAGTASILAVLADEMEKLEHFRTKVGLNNQPRVAESFLSSRIFLNQELRYCVNKILPLVSILSEVNRIHAILSYSLKMQFSNLSFTSCSSKWTPSFRFTTKTLCIRRLSRACHFFRPFLPTSSGYPNKAGEGNKS